VTDACSVTLYLIRSLLKAAKRGKESAWPFVPSKDITRQDVERFEFVTKHQLRHVTVSSNDKAYIM
jgi:hypothetical protein